MIKAAMGKVTRNDQLSCSQLPALMAIDPYKTANDVLRRCCDAIRGIEEDFTPNEAMGWGTRLEGAILDEAAARLGCDLEHGFDTAFKAQDIPLACSLDGKIKPVMDVQAIRTDPERGIFVMNDSGEIIVKDAGLLESKLTSVAPEDSPALHRGPIQLQGQMICTGTTWGAVAVLYRGTELRVFVFEAHAGTQDAIIKASRDFEARLTTFAETGEMDWFPLQSAEDGSRTFSEAKEVEVVLDDDMVKYAHQYDQACRLIKQYEEQKEAATIRLMDAMGQADKARAGAWQITWGSRSYKAQPEKITPAKAAYTVRNKSITVKEAK